MISVLQYDPNLTVKFKMAAVSHIENYFLAAWLMLQIYITFLGFSGSRNSFITSVMQSDSDLTFKSKMAAAARIENYVFNVLADIAVHVAVLRFSVSMNSFMILIVLTIRL